MVKADGDGEDDVDNDELSPIELSERSKVVVSGANLVTRISSRPDR